MMQEPIEQARFIHNAIRLLQHRYLPRALARRAQSSSCLDLTISQFNALNTIRFLGQASIKELAEALTVSAPSASAMVDRLVELGAVTREPSQTDRREVVVRLTPEGERTAAQTEEFVLSEIAALITRIGPRYAQMWCEVYQRIAEVVSEGGDSPSK